MNKISLGVLILLIVIAFFGFFFFRNSDLYVKRKIKTERLAMINDDEKEILKSLVLKDELQRENLKISQELVIDNTYPSFCKKTGTLTITGAFTPDQNKTYDKLFISFIKDNNTWSICNSSTGP